MKKKLRIGNAGGYWGDDPDALMRQVFYGDPLDYITMDFLAEVTMSIMQKQKLNDPNRGYAHDFIKTLDGVLPKAMERKTRIITNAGGVNPVACAKAVSELAGQLGVSPKIVIVEGDDILENIDELRDKGQSFANMETGQDFKGIRDQIESANIYFGADGVVEALKYEPDIIITGRVTDTGITLAPMIYHFGWSFNDWDKLAHGVVAGHILECGTQATGGNFTDWQKVENYHDLGFPIVEIEEDGKFTVTKHQETGGIVTVDTVREQLFYEMGNPKAYITPDVVADFASIKVKQVDADRVEVYGIIGFEPTPYYKVSMAFSDGFKCTGAIAISGPEARKKAERFAEILWKKAGQGFKETQTEYFGWNACHRSLGHQEDGNEILLRLSVRSEEREKCTQFGKLIPALILSGPAGVAVIGGAPKPQNVVSYWPALMDKNLVKPKVRVLSEKGVEEHSVGGPVIGNFTESKDDDYEEANQVSMPIQKVFEGEQSDWVPMSLLCLGRSGDKGDSANIGILARGQDEYEFLDKFLTAQKVKDYFQELCLGKVTKYRLPNLLGFNFILENALGGGGTQSLRTDAQGKMFAQALLRQRVPAKSLIRKDTADSRSSISYLS